MRAATFLFALALLIAPLAAEEGPTGPFVVHEWGTFTGFAGSDGVYLEYRPIVDNELPAFVYDRARQAGLSEERQLVLSKSGMSALQRMETPVLYFYTDQPREVDVRVDFPEGIMTEFFPPVREMAPAYVPGQPEPLTGGMLRWGRVLVFPESMLATLQPDARVPAVEGDNHYAYARETDSALVRRCDKSGMQDDYYEKFLFYRGVGNFRLPIQVEAKGGDRIVVSNGGAQPIHSVFAVNVREGRVRFAKASSIAPGGSVEVSLPADEASADALSDAMAGALVAEGLYEKEARAMVKTWRTSWMGEEGTRLFYMVPREATDRLLPLTLEPEPDELVRVLVGRLEFLTPEREAEIASLVRSLGAESPSERDAATDSIAAMGRFADPALRRALESTRDAEVRARAERLLEQLRQR